jgi:predicted ATPase
VIQTPDQRLRVFVSSTLAELAEERAAVARAINALRLSPVMFELGARPHPPQELYRAYLAQSDIFVGLYWQSYGWVGPGMDISGLEDEFRLSGGRPRLLYLKAPAPDRQPRLTQMIAEIEAEGTDAYRTFRTTRELSRLVRDDLAVLLSERFAAGGPARTVTGAASATPAAPAPAERSIPAASTSLIGRDADIAAVTEMLQDRAYRLVTLTGPGGVGKTRLAMAVGERITGMRPVFVPLASVTDPAAVLPRIAAVVGATVEGTVTPVAALAERLADEPTLLILDNLEQVVGAAPALDDLLAASATVTMLVTSRTVLRLRAEHEYPLAGLTDADAAVRLFADRARAVRSSFAVDERNVADIAEICRRLDGLPLAIELAAARIRLMEPAALLRRLSTVLDTLGAGPVDLPERQRTLRAAVEWSVGLLEDDSRDLLAALSIFADGCTLDAATHVCGVDEDAILDGLDLLSGHSLIAVDASGDEPRFRMLTAVREYAAELLAAEGQHDQLAERHARWFAALVGDGVPTGERQSAWAARLRLDEENLRASIRWFFDHDVAPLPHMFRSLWVFWQLIDRMPEARAWIEELHGRGDDLDDHDRAEMLFSRSVTADEVGDDAVALESLGLIDQLRPRLDDSGLEGALQLARSWTLPIDGSDEAALDAATRALAGLEQTGDQLVGFAELTVGMLSLALFRSDAARAHLGRLVELSDRLGNDWLRSTARTQLAILAVRDGDVEAARGLLAAALGDVTPSNVSTLSMTFALVAAAEIALAGGDPAAAATALAAVQGLRERSGLRPWPLARPGEADLQRRLSATGALDDGTGAGFHLRDALTWLRSRVDGRPRR